MTISAKPGQIVRLVIFSIQIAMMHYQNALIYNSTGITHLQYARSLHQSPIGCLTSYPVRGVFSATVMLVFPGAMTGNGAEEFTASRPLKVLGRSINLFTTIITKHPSAVNLRFRLALFRAVLTPPLLRMPTLYQYLFAANNTPFAYHLNIIHRQGDHVK